MFCSKCGNKSEEGDKFCNNCGDNLFEEATTEVVVHQKKGYSSKIAPDRRFLVISGLGTIGAVIIYIVFSQTPFSFLARNRSIDINVITSSVVHILCESRLNGDISSGSGTIITKDGVVITNSHIIPQDKKELYVKEIGCLVVLPERQTGQPEEIYWAKPIVIPDLSDQYDLAYLQIYAAYTDEEKKTYGKYPKIFQSIFAEADKYDDICSMSWFVKLGDPIRIYGYPQASGGLHLTVTDGIVSSFPEKGLIYTSAKIDAGNSGGLAVDGKGCMVGVPSAISTGKHQNLGVIISTELVLEFSEKIDKIKEDQ